MTTKYNELIKFIESIPRKAITESLLPGTPLPAEMQFRNAESQGHNNLLIDIKEFIESQPKDKDDGR